MHWYSGTWVSASKSEPSANTLLDSPGLRFGASVFTTMRVYDQSLEDRRSQYAAHCDRLAQSIHTFHWQPPNWPFIYEGCAQLKHHYPILRITLFPDGSEWITGRDLPPHLTEQQQSGITCWRAPPAYKRSLPTHKTGNYLACQLARQQAQTQGAQEAILTDERGDWLETTTGNLWGWAKGQWWTPSDSWASSHCLPGLMRNRLQQSLAADQQIVNSQSWSQLVQANFEAIAYSNCVVELIPIHTILDGHITLEYDPQHVSLIALRQRLTGPT